MYLLHYALQLNANIVCVKYSTNLALIKFLTYFLNEFKGTFRFVKLKFIKLCIVQFIQQCPTIFQRIYTNNLLVYHKKH